MTLDAPHRVTRLSASDPPAVALRPRCRIRRHFGCQFRVFFGLHGASVDRRGAEFTRSVRGAGFLVAMRSEVQLPGPIVWRNQPRLVLRY